MNRSTDRILTSHVGSLPRPAELIELYKSGAEGDALETGLREAVVDVVKRQRDHGIDIINDGEYGHPMKDALDYAAFSNYTYDRLTGYEVRMVPPTGETELAMPQEFIDFEAYYAGPEGAATWSTDPEAPFELGVNVDEITYVGQEMLERDIANFKAALPDGSEGSAFMTSIAPGMEIYEPPSEHYANADEQFVATAEAMRTEYKAIADAGLIVQLDDPMLVDYYGHRYAKSGDYYAKNGDFKSYRKWAERHIEILNHAIEGIPAEQVRLHVCWGSWKGPHTSDLPIAEVLDLLMKVNVGLYSTEASNPMHEHEWRAWQEIDLPEGKVVMPGVVSHKTNVLEHPQVVADRIVSYANAVGRENVIAGTDCGMGGRTDTKLAWAKLKSLADGAEIASKQLWS